MSRGWLKIGVNTYKSPAKPRVHWSNISPLVTVLVMTKLLLSCREYFFSILVGSILQLRTHFWESLAKPSKKSLVFVLSLVINTCHVLYNSKKLVTLRIHTHRICYLSCLGPCQDALTRRVARLGKGLRHWGNAPAWLAFFLRLVSGRRRAVRALQVDSVHIQKLRIIAYRAIIEHAELQNDNFELLRQQYKLYNVCKYFLHFCGSSSLITILIRMYNNVSMPTSYAAELWCRFAFSITVT